MSQGKLADLYLPAKVAYHVKILLGGIFVTIFFGLIWKGTPFPQGFLFMVFLVVVQLEIFMAMALRIFRPGRIESGKDYKSKIIKRLIWFYLLCFAIAMAFLFGAISVNMLLYDAKFSDVMNQFLLTELKPFLISWLIGISLGSLVFFYFEWNHGLKREQKLKEEKLIFQYETLKNQVNPHFLFNSLNTLSSLVSKDPQLSEKFIAKFSSIYRYVLENKDRELVGLDEELKFVKDFFFLQKIRDDGKIDLQIDINSPERYQVLPISVQLLVENALKHNAATVDNPLKIHITFKDENTLVVENNLQKKMHLVPSSKIGLKNLGERISLVLNRNLKLEEGEGKFIVELPVIPG